ncbi:hypothetical protein AMC87_PD00679 (plasmid) [Rhizobium phaseoli]|uniref:Uncharacterized protein n=1 Tax=Rhizobium etli (strain CIAT 652) TaxID=491916 RepID=B3Q3F0_RHIE6|nr:hypothetical protein RHECIAT_PC0000630 [Rhizobium etli CIAT 652]ANL50802.1 hypothetical protein AMC87_PD00679 [Rhizobium phaseoli]PCD68854.1 hypothetical protein CO648_07760 [Rhizobium phaseoli]PDS28760.1 hypothetical protein CO650_24690 [Rhizobium phaseoli]PWI51470.1 hypothetical protein B5K03_25450 [Rhizobium phaseoli]
MDQSPPGRCARRSADTCKRPRRRKPKGCFCLKVGLSTLRAGDPDRAPKVAAPQKAERSLNFLAAVSAAKRRASIAATSSSVTPQMTWAAFSEEYSAG